MQWMVGGDVVFTPVRGNLPFGASPDRGFDLQLIGGLGLGQTRRVSEVSIGPQGQVSVEGYQHALSPMFSFGLALNLNVVRWLALRLEYRNFLFPEPGEGIGGINSRPHAQFGLQFALGGGPEQISPGPETTSTVAGKFELSAAFNASLFDRLVASEGVSASIAYHLTDRWAFRLTGAKHFPHETDGVTEGLYSFFRFHGINRSSPTESQLLWVTEFDVQWSPLSGKLSVFDYTFGFTPILSVGIGLGESRIRCAPGWRLDPDIFGPDVSCPLIDPAEETNFTVYEPPSLRAIGTLAAGVRVDLSNRLAITIEFKDAIYRSRIARPDGLSFLQLEATRHTVFTTFGLSVLLGGAD